MALTVQKQFELLLARHRWAFEELVFDCKCRAWNRAYSKGKFIRGRKREGDLEEAYFERKKAEAEKLFESANAMVVYLTKRYGSVQKVLAELRHLVSVQGERRKTTWRTE